LGKSAGNTIPSHSLMVGLLLLNNSISHVHMVVKCDIWATMYNWGCIELIQKRQLKNGGQTSGPGKFVDS